MHFLHMPSDPTIRSVIAELENSNKGAIAEINQRQAFKKSEKFSLNFIKLKVANKSCTCSAVSCPRRFKRVCVRVCVCDLRSIAF